MDLFEHDVAEEESLMFNGRTMNINYQSMINNGLSRMNQ